MYRRIVELMLIAGFTAWVLVACATPARGPAAGNAKTGPVGKVLHVGILGPFTGASARTGDEFKGSVIMALDSVNYKVGNYNLQPVWIDSQYDPEKATRAYEEAIVGQGIQVRL